VILSDPPVYSGLGFIGGHVNKDGRRAYSVDAQGEAKEVGSPAEIKVCAKIVHGDYEYNDESTCATAKIAPAVVLEGCEWVKGENVLDGTTLGPEYKGETYSAKAVYKYSFGRCADTPTGVELAYGANPATATNLDCSGDFGDYTPQQATCPALTVTPPAPGFGGKAAFGGGRTLTNNYWFYSGETVALEEGTAALATDREDCSISIALRDPSEGIGENGAAKALPASVEIQACAVATCSLGDGPYTGESTCAAAKIAPDVVLSGCVWVGEDGQPLEVGNNGLVTVDIGDKVRPKADFASNYGRCTDNGAEREISGLAEITGAQTSLSCVSHQPPQADCPTVVVRRPEPVALGDVGFTSYDHSDVFFIGADVASRGTGVSIENAEDADCGPVTYTASGNANIAGTIEVCARATCNGSAKELNKCTNATIVPDASLSGECAWGVPGNKTSPTVGAIPGGVSLADSYGRCGAFADGALPGNAYSHNGNAWPADGKGLAEATYAGVQTNLLCVQQQASCPALTVTSAMCGKKADGDFVELSDLCPGTTDFASVKWNQRPTYANNTVTAGCYYVKDFTGDQYNIQNTSNWRINGTPFSVQSDIRNAANAKVDGGIYICTLWWQSGP